MAFSTLALKPSFLKVFLHSQLALAQAHFLNSTTRCLAVTDGSVVSAAD